MNSASTVPHCGPMARKRVIECVKHVQRQLQSHTIITKQKDKMTGWIMVYTWGKRHKVRDSLHPLKRNTQREKKLTYFCYPIKAKHRGPVHQSPVTHLYSMALALTDTRIRTHTRRERERERAHARTVTHVQGQKVKSHESF